MHSWNKFFKLIKLPLLFAVSVPATAISFLSSSCFANIQQFTIKGKNEITITQGEAGNEVYKLVDDNDNLVDLGKYTLDFEQYPSLFKPEDFCLSKDEKNNNWVIKWTDRLSNINDTTVKIIAKDTKDNQIGSLQVFIGCVGFKSLKVKSNNNIYSFLDSRVLGGKQKVSVLYPNGEQEAEAKSFKWDVTIPQQIQDYLIFNKDSGYFEVKKDFDSSLSGTYEIELVVSDINGKYEKSFPKKINFVVQNVSKQLLLFSTKTNDDGVIVSIDHDTPIFPVNFSIPKYTDDGREITGLGNFSLKKEAKFTKLTNKWVIEKIQFDCAENIRYIYNDFFAESDEESQVDISKVNFDFSIFTKLDTIGSDFLANNKSFTGNGSNFTFSCSSLNIGEFFISNCPKFNSKISLNGSGLKTIPKNFVSYDNQFNSEVTLPNQLEKIEDCFLYNDPLFNHQIYFPNDIKVIGSNFLSGDYSFNSPVDLKALKKLSKIGENFLDNCKHFNSSLCIPENVNEIGSGFLHNCNDLTVLIEILCDGAVFAGSDDSFSVSSSDAIVYKGSGFKVSPLSADFFYKFKNISKPGCFRKIYPSNFQTYLELKTEENQSYSVSSKSSISPTEFNGHIILPGNWHNNGIDRKLSIINDDFFLNYSQSLKSIFIPDSLKKIMDNFFKKSKFNSSIDFSNLTLLETIGNGFFEECDEFSFGIDLSKTSIKSIGSKFMYGCKKFSVNQLILPDTLQTIGDSFLQDTFSDSESDELVIPGKVNEIGIDFLRNVKFLGKVVINSHIKFGNNAFQKNSSQENPTKVKVPKDELNYYNSIFKDQIDKGWIELV